MPICTHRDPQTGFETCPLQATHMANLPGVGWRFACKGHLPALRDVVEAIAQDTKLEKARSNPDRKPWYRRLLP